MKRWKADDDDFRKESPLQRASHLCFNRKEKVDASLGHTGPESGEVEVPVTVGARKCEK